MAAPLEMIMAVIAVLSFVVNYHVAKRSGSGLFAYSLLIASTISIALLAASLMPAHPAVQAVADAGILIAGVLAFAASGWLIFAFSQAGDAGGR